jgi:hypothetical protein
MANPGLGDILSLAHIERMAQQAKHAAAALPSSVMNSRRLMGLRPQDKDHTLAHRWARAVLRIAAKWAAY